MMSDLALALRQVKYENLAFWRNPAAAFFTIAFPLMFLVLLNLAFGNEEVDVGGAEVRQATLLIPSIVAFSVITACYTNIAINISFARDQGLLKRTRGTPLPAWAFLFGRIAHAILIALMLVAAVVTAGALFYGVGIPTITMPAFLVSLTLGAATFCSLGLAVTAAIPNADASPGIVNASILPLLFVSNVFIPLQDPPVWLGLIREVFPVKHFSDALQAAFTPLETGSGLQMEDLLAVGLWGLVGIAVALRFFSWEPRR